MAPSRTAIRLGDAGCTRACRLWPLAFVPEPLPSPFALLERHRLRKALASKERGPHRASCQRETHKSESKHVDVTGINDYIFWEPGSTIYGNVHGVPPVTPSNETSC